MNFESAWTTRLTRRGWLVASSGALVGTAASGWLQRLATAEGPRPKRSCLLLWMNGGPSQTDTFDMKPEHANGGPFQAIDTRTPGIELCEHLPGVAQWTDQLAVIRSMSTKEGDHGRARDNLRTGYFPQASIQFPVLGSLVSKEFEERAGDLPNYVSIFPRGLFNLGMPPAGFLGPDYAPLLVGQENDGNENGQRLAVENLALPPLVTADQARARLELLHHMERRFFDERPGAAADGHRTAYAK